MNHVLTEMSAIYIRSQVFRLGVGVTVSELPEHAPRCNSNSKKDTQIQRLFLKKRKKKERIYKSLTRLCSKMVESRRRNQSNHQRLENVRLHNLKMKNAANEQLKKIRIGKRDIRDVILEMVLVRNSNGGVFALERNLLRYNRPNDRLSCTEFKYTLEKLGYSGLPEQEISKLFSRHETGEAKLRYGDFVSDLVQRHKEESKRSLTATKVGTIGGSSAGFGARLHLQKQQMDAEVARAWNSKSVDAEKLLLEKLEQRMKSGANSCGLINAFRKFDMGNDKAEIGYDEFHACVQRLGLQGFSHDVVKRLFSKYANQEGKINFKNFVDGIMRSYAHQNSISISGGGLTPQMEAARRAKEAKRNAVAKRHWNTLKIDLKKVLLEKIEQRTVSGQHQLRKAFRRFDKGSTSSVISYQEFKDGIVALGLGGLSEAESMSLFKSFDTNGDGDIDFSEFVSGVMQDEVNGDAFPASRPADLCQVEPEEQKYVIEKTKHAHARHKKHRHCRHRRERTKRKHQEKKEARARSQALKQQEQHHQPQTSTRDTKHKTLVRNKLTVSEPTLVGTSMSIPSQSAIKKYLSIEPASSFLEYKSPTIVKHDQ